jgi:hypothetical protein
MFYLIATRGGPHEIFSGKSKRVKLKNTNKESAFKSRRIESNLN